MFDAIRRAAIWWGRELQGMVPERLIRLFALPSHSFVCDWEKNTAKLWHVQSNDRALVRTLELSAEPPTKLELPAPRGLARLTRKRPTLAVHLRPDNVLTKRILLPRAGEADLKDIVALQIERQTPLTPR